MTDDVGLDDCSMSPPNDKDQPVRTNDIEFGTRAIEHSAASACYASLPDGIIELDSDRALPIAFTSQRFGTGSYLWKLGGKIVVSFIESLSRGNFRQLVEAIRGNELTVEVPTPLGRMQDIVRKAGYRQTWPWCEEFGECVEVWVLDA